MTRDLWGTRGEGVNFLSRGGRKLKFLLVTARTTPASQSHREGCIDTLHSFTFILPQDVPILQSEQSRLREVRQLAHGGTAWKQKEGTLAQAGQLPPPTNAPLMGTW